MRKIILVLIIAISVFKGYSQCTTCHDGRNLDHTPNNNAHKVPNGNGTLGVSFDTTLCGLNYIQAIQNTQTRYAASPGTGFPTHDTVKGLPVGCFKVVKAYLYCEASCQVASPATYTIVDTVTNPNAVKSVFNTTLVGTSIGKCWGDQSTGTWRADVTSAISGNGAYRINFKGFTTPDFEVDGISLVIVYEDNTLTYTGTFVLSDGEDAVQGGSETYTATGFTACDSSSSASAFTDFADIQNNVETNFTFTENGTTGTFPALFFQAATVNTSVTNGQNTSTTAITLGGDCYAMFLYGLYFQTPCRTCIPVSLSFSAHATPTPCGADSGSAKVTVSDTVGVTYHWSNGATTSSISGLSAGIYTVSITGNGGCPIDTAVVIVTSPDSVYAHITASRDSVCSGDSLTLRGAGGKKYLWSPGGGTSATIHVNPVSTTTYTLHTFSSECKDSAKVTIKVVPKITDTLTAINDTVCPLDPTTLTAAVAGGVATYKWSNGATTSSITVHDTVTTTYTATAYGICDSVKKTIKVTIVPLPKPVISGLNWKCAGIKDTLKVSSSTNPTTYLWSNGKTTTTIITGAIKGDSIFTVTAFNRLGCPVTVIDTVLLRQPPLAMANPPSLFCAGQAITLTASGSGTYAPFTYTWSTGQTGTSITIDPGPDSTTTYTVTVSNGCTTTAFTTAIPNVPILYACCNQILSIEHDSANRHDTAILVASGNSAKYQWLEQPDNGSITCLNPPLCDSVRVITTVSTTYTVVGTDSNGCQTEQLLFVTIDIPCFDLTIPNVFTPTNPGILGLDDVFYIKTQNVNGWDLTIFDRWGKEMYHSTNPYQYWNGNTEGGSKASAGVYYYIINATCQNSTYKKDGFVQLIR